MEMMAMGKNFTTEQVLKALVEARYFDSPSSMQEVFRNVVEDDLGISLDRAMDQVCQSGLARSAYPDVSLHPRDRIDAWTVTLTEAGLEALKRLGC